jgi:hypothetical protein
MNALAGVVAASALLQGVAVAHAASAANSSNGATDFFSLTPGTPGFTYLGGLAGYQQTTGYTCGPSSVMSVLHYYGALNDSSMNHATEMRLAREMGTNANNGTSAEQIAAWFAAQGGWDVYWSTNGTLTTIRDNLARGVPTIVDWIDWGGHWVAALGYFAGGATPGDGQDTVFFADPAAHFQNVANPLGVTGFTSDRFQAMWISDLDLPIPRRGVHVVATPRKHARPQLGA